MAWQEAACFDRWLQVLMHKGKACGFVEGHPEADAGKGDTAKIVSIWEPGCHATYTNQLANQAQDSNRKRSAQSRMGKALFGGASNMQASYPRKVPQQGKPLSLDAIQCGARRNSNTNAQTLDDLSRYFSMSFTILIIVAISS